MKLNQLLTALERKLNDPIRFEEAKELITHIDSKLRGLTIENKGHRIKIVDIDYKPDFDINTVYENFNEIKDIKARKGTYGIKFYGIVDIDGKRQRIRLGIIPIQTDLGSYIIGGSEYTVTTQIRRRPGVYIVPYHTGYIARFNSAKGRNFEIIFDDGNLVLQVGTRHFPISYFLKALGFPESYYSQFDTGSKKDYKKILKGIYESFFYGKSLESVEEMEKALRDYMENNTYFEPDVLEQTIGIRDNHASNQVIQKAIEKLVAVASGKAQPDNMNNIAFKTFHKDIDLLKERFDLYLEDIIKSIKKRMAGSKVPVRPGEFGRPLITLFTGSGLANFVDQNNPIDIMANVYRVSPFGEGGYTDERLLPEEMRFVDPSVIGLIDPVFTPEGKKVGLITFLTTGLGKIENKNAYVRLYDVRKKKPVLVPNTRLAGKKIAFHGSGIWDGTKLVRLKSNVQGIIAGQSGVKQLDPKEVDYIIPDTAFYFSPSTLLIPFVEMNHGNRLAMGSKHITQALPLTEPEPPIISTKSKMFDDFYETFGKFSSITSPVEGTVKEINLEKGFISIKDATGKLHQVAIPINYPLNSGQRYTVTDIKVKEGDRVKKGQLLADTNFTKNGILAIGKNLTVGYAPAKFLNYRDGVIISESAAKKLSSMHSYLKSIKKDQNVILDKKKFIAMFPGYFTDEQLAKIGDNGVVRKGVELNPGDPIFLVIRRYIPTQEEAILGKAFKKVIKPYKADPVIWDNDVVGKVTYVRETPSQAMVQIDTEEPARIGDKISARYGNKGVITAVIPDHLMPRIKKTGEPIDVLFSPLTVPSRLNPGQLAELLLAKYAKQTGKRISVSPFDPQNKKLLEEAAKVVKDKEVVIDPETGVEKEIAVGPAYILKLKMTAARGFSGRGFDEGYDINMQPIGGSKGGAKALSWLQQLALLAHGASGVLNEKRFYTSERNPDFWKSIEFGYPLPAPKPTFATRKLFAMLKGAGINVLENKDQVILAPLTDKDVLEISNGEVPNPEKMIIGKSGMPEKGGLFDVNILGGTSGDKWGHFRLAEPVINPISESAIKMLTGLSDSDLDKVIRGTAGVEYDGDRFVLTSKGGVKSLKRALNSLDIDKEIKKIEQEMEKARGTNLDKLNKKIKILRNLKKMGLKAGDAYVLSVYPILPPVFRPVFQTESGDRIISEINQGYRDLALINKQLKELQQMGVNEGPIIERLRSELYRGVKALSGLASPLSPRPYRGFLEQIKGPRNTEGFYQNKVIRSKQDVAGRAVIGVAPDLHIDEIGIPEPLAWKIFQPSIVKELLSMGFTRKAALEQIEQQTDAARRALDKVAKEAYVLANREPTLHQYGLLAFKPKILPAKNPFNQSDLQLKLSPAVFVPFNADLDGDQMTVYYVLTKKAVEDAKKMLPSKKLIQYGYNRVLMIPPEEGMLTFYRLTTVEKSTNKRFPNFQELEKAYKQRKIGARDEVYVGSRKTTYARYRVSQILGKYWDGKPLDKKHLNSLLTEIAKQNPDDAVKIIDQLQDLARDLMFEVGGSFSYSDLLKLNKEFNRMAEKTKADSDTIFNKVYKKHKDLAEIIESGSRGKPVVYRQLFGSVDPKNPKKPAYIEGLDEPTFMSFIQEAREGMIGRYLEVAKPGEETKRIAAASLPLRITDIETRDPGIEMSINDPDIIDRFLAQDVEAKGKKLAKKGDQITKDLVSQLKKNGIRSVKVMSPLSSKKGIAAKSFGLLDDGNLPDVGLPIGILATHAFTEPLTQMALNKFHTAQGNKDPFKELQKFTVLPKDEKYYGVLAPISGKIVDIVSIRNKKYIIIDNGKVQQKVKIPFERKIKVKIGDKVEKGQLLTDGDPNPYQMLELKGIIPTRQYLTDKLKALFEQSGIPLRRRYIETVVRGITNFVRITDPGDSDLVKGDVISADYYDALREKLRKEGKNPPEGRYVLAGSNMAPFYSTDFLTRMIAGKIKSTLTEGALEGWGSRVQSLSPVPQMILGPVNLNDIDLDEALKL